jgi:3-hydroxybutyryl-CoA dehydrogenase
VEVIGNELTEEEAIAGAEAFYRRLGKETIRVRREVPGHVANRLQVALWREAIHLVNEGVASVEDVDKAIWAGPGLRWAAMGPHMLFHLAAGPGGLEEFCKRYAPSTSRWWADLGRPELTPEVIAELAEGVAAEAHGRSVAETAKERDALIQAMLKATKGLRTG